MNDLYLKINELEKFNENLKECINEIIHSTISNNLIFSYKSVVCWKELSYTYVEYESYFNPHANPKHLRDYKKFSNTNEAVNFVLEKITETLL